ncbi:DNA translocase FtsK [Staphylococcus massiliensis]|uniref:DNA translocase FtsK n=1 Tax=Staphylococcus massiliensis TaxID=555791 RepID=UPI001EE082BB|nr:DNA translocase FtsK [Staphylococcus massiliensis]MCG3399722.1 DNA translocase FtsK [Staphylococcus massiliensis]
MNWFDKLFGEDDNSNEPSPNRRRKMRRQSQHDHTLLPQHNDVYQRPKGKFRFPVEMKELEKKQQEPETFKPKQDERAPRQQQFEKPSFQRRDEINSRRNRRRDKVDSNQQKHETTETYVPSNDKKTSKPQTKERYKSQRYTPQPSSPIAPYGTSSKQKKYSQPVKANFHEREFKASEVPSAIFGTKTRREFINSGLNRPKYQHDDEEQDTMTNQSQNHEPSKESTTKREHTSQSAENVEQKSSKPNNTINIDNIYASQIVAEIRREREKKVQQKRRYKDQLEEKRQQNKDSDDAIQRAIDEMHRAQAKRYLGESSDDYEPLESVEIDNEDSDGKDQVNASDSEALDLNDTYTYQEIDLDADVSESTHEADSEETKHDTTYAHSSEEAESIPNKEVTEETDNETITYQDVNQEEGQTQLDDETQSEAGLEHASSHNDTLSDDDEAESDREASTETPEEHDSNQTQESHFNEAEASHDDTLSDVQMMYEQSADSRPEVSSEDYDEADDTENVPEYESESESEVNVTPPPASDASDLQGATVPVEDETQLFKDDNFEPTTESNITVPTSDINEADESESSDQDSDSDDAVDEMNEGQSATQTDASDQDDDSNAHDDSNHGVDQEIVESQGTHSSYDVSSHTSEKPIKDTQVNEGETSEAEGQSQQETKTAQNVQNNAFKTPIRKGSKPFNVVMTPSDKKRMMDRKKAQQQMVPPLKPEGQKFDSSHDTSKEKAPSQQTSEAKSEQASEAQASQQPSDNHITQAQEGQPVAHSQEPNDVTQPQSNHQDAQSGMNHAVAQTEQQATKPADEKRTIRSGPNLKLPEMKLLDEPEVQEVDESFIDEKKTELNEAFYYFNVPAEVVNVVRGPSVTRFELSVEKGVKVSRITALQDDIKMALAAKDIRIEAPIPGTSLVGIEVPNQTPTKVNLKSIVDDDKFKKAESKLTVAMGNRINNDPLLMDIQKTPHALIAGATGSGKSVCINSILVSLLYRNHPEELRLLLIDPKMVELAPYNDLPHLISPVITDVKAATQSLKWAVDEMERRYKLFAHYHVRNITAFNKKAKYEDRLPKIVIVIDELADLMMMAPQDVEQSIARIAQKARACGIHMLVATQRPSVNVITGLIKANIPTRIAFMVSSSVDSRTILDSGGAERLLGYGDMLYLGNGMNKPIRVQGTFVSDDEIDRVVDYIKQQRKPNYEFEEKELLKKTHEQPKDELFNEVCRFMVQENNISTSLIQRQFQIGYNRAARIVSQLEQLGYISGQNGSKPREVYISESDLEEI